MASLFTLSTTLFYNNITPILNPVSKLPKLLGQSNICTRYTHYSRVKSASSAMAADETKIKVAPAIIVGGGRVGRALQEMGNGDDLLIKRGEAVPLDFAGPILVCTRNDDLEAVLQATPQSRWTDEVFCYRDRKEEVKMAAC